MAPAVGRSRPTGAGRVVAEERVAFWVTVMRMGAATSAGAGATKTFRCDRCDRNFVSSELRQVRAGSGYVQVCPSCGDPPRLEVSRALRSLPVVLAGAFTYPFRGTTLLWVAVVLVATTVLRFVPIVGGLIAVSAELGFLFAVLRSTAEGQAEMNVEASDLADYSLWFRPLIKYVAALVVSFAPALAVQVALDGGVFGENGTSTFGWLLYVLAAGGVLYLPAALVVAAHSDGCLGVLNPAAGLSFIARIPGPYAVTVVFLAVAAGVCVGMMAAAAALDVPVLGVVARSVAALYGPLVAMRMLGLLMAEHAEEL